MITAAITLFAALNITVPAAAQSAPLADQDSELLRYIRGENAPAACGVCLGAAREFFDEQEKARLAKFTAGMALVPAGRYRLGSPEGAGDPDERPAADIQLDAFYMDKTEVTLADYFNYMKTAGGKPPEWLEPGGQYNIETGKQQYYAHLGWLPKDCPTCPVFGVAWKDAADYCAWKKKRLPTEAEWEAAARGGSTTTYSFGDSDARAGDYAWLESNSGGAPHPTAVKKPNAYGLYDMHGNLWEWTADFYSKNYYTLRDKRDPAGPAAGTEHVIRGGSWAFDADAARAANRASTNRPNDDIGFRCALSKKDVAAR